MSGFYPRGKRESKGRGARRTSALPINTPLQRGGRRPTKEFNGFNRFTARAARAAWELREVLECGSPLPLFLGAWLWRAAAAGQ